MRAVIQRVDRASVRINHQELSSIDKGILILLGVGKADTETDADYILEKAVNLRIFEDEYNKMNRSLIDIKGAMMIISQFTLMGNCIKGRRPSFTDAEEPSRANQLYEYLIGKAKEKGTHVETGKFQEMMKIELVNDGPVTILIDSKKKF
ncbi:MAG: D-tyrosyl-tRNA(Tyr) deacylase [Syntrophaceae bacterium]|nr:D-tyrosyl-tRNA(Tyr) deacylase [Syntrophaceae bacterium]